MDKKIRCNFSLTPATVSRLAEYSRSICNTRSFSVDMAINLMIEQYPAGDLDALFGDNAPLYRFLFPAFERMDKNYQAREEREKTRGVGGFPRP